MDNYADNYYNFQVIKDGQYLYGTEEMYNLFLFLQYVDLNMNTNDFIVLIILTIFVNNMNTF